MYMVSFSCYNLVLVDLEYLINMVEENKYLINGVEYTLVFNPEGRPRYKINGNAATGVTTILSVINKPELQPWVARLCVREAFLKAYYMEGKLGQLAKELEDLPKLSKSDATKLAEKYPEFAEAIIAHTKKSDDAKDIGTLAHAQVEAYIRWKMGEKDSFTLEQETAHMVQPFIDWAEGRVQVKTKTYRYDKNSIEIVPTTIKFLRAEQKVFSLKRYAAGTFDFLAEIDGKKYMCDFKTSTGIYGREYFYQTAAYRAFAEELGWGTDVVGSIIIRSGKDGNDLEVKHSLSYKEDLKAFDAAFILYKEGFTDIEMEDEKLTEPH